MEADYLSWPVVLAPLALVTAGLLWFGRIRPWRPGVVATIWAMLAYYLYWRIGTTIPWDASGWKLAWPLVVLAIELAALFDALILHLTLLKPTDRSAEADAHETRLRAMPAAALPSVDVFIATYNEPPEVLEKTMVGALALDWPEARVWVLDDGRRAWLRDFCLRKGAGYITRPDNKGAKAGNINHALAVTDAEFVMVLDADFVPRRDFLMRTMGFFADARIGIVQVPHSFYNHDPMQANLGLRGSLPNDQRFFFECIMPGRDAWDAAFCCGSNSVTRRSLFDALGGKLPEGSITEDMLLTLAGLRAGHVTRYLNEPLTYGLAPESVSAFFVQRERWAQGCMQILHLREGPLGPGLKLIQRLMFLPSHYVTQTSAMLLSVLAPIVFLLTGLPPLTNVGFETVMQRLLPMVVASIGGIVALAPGRYFPLAFQTLNLFMSFRILPVALQTLLRPKGLLFKVTPKGSNVASGWQPDVLAISGLLILLTAAGVVVNARPEWRIVEQAALVPMVGFWCFVNIILLLFVCMMCLQLPARRGEERFPLREPVRLRRPGGELTMIVPQGDLSLSGLGAFLPADQQLGQGERIVVELPRVGAIEGVVAYTRGRRLGLRFVDVGEAPRDRLIESIYASGFIQPMEAASVAEVTVAMLRRLLVADMRVKPANLAAELTTGTMRPSERLPARSYVIPPATMQEITRPALSLSNTG